MWTAAARRSQTTEVQIPVVSPVIVHFDIHSP
jgi:hypothetical protein